MAGKILAILIVLTGLAASRFHVIQMSDGHHIVEKPAFSLSHTYINTTASGFDQTFEELPKLTREWILKHQASLVGDKIKGKLQDVGQKILNGLDQAMEK